MDGAPPQQQAWSWSWKQFAWSWQELPGAGRVEELERQLANHRRWLAAELALRPAPPFLGDEIFVLVAAYLSVRDLGRLACVAKRFTASSMHDPTHTGAGSAEMWSPVEEGARRSLLNRDADRQAWVPRRDGDSWLRLARQLEVLSAPLIFDRAAIGHVVLSAGGARATKTSEDEDEFGDSTGFRAASCGSACVLRAGVHFAQFTLVGERAVAMVGIIRPDWDVEEGHSAEEEPEHCFYWSATGRRFGGSDEAAPAQWEGMETATGGERIGMLLDMTSGTMTVYKNDRRLGVMATDLSGEFCWAVSLGMQPGTSVQISKDVVVPQPPAPRETEEDAGDQQEQELPEAEQEEDAEEDDQDGEEGEEDEEDEEQQQEDEEDEEQQQQELQEEQQEDEGGEEEMEDLNAMMNLSSLSSEEEHEGEAD